MSGLQACPRRVKRLQLENVDYSWRPRILEHVPFYFFPALCTAENNRFPALPWHCEFTPAAGGHTAAMRKNIHVSAEGTWRTHPDASFLTSSHLENMLLKDATSDLPLVSRIVFRYETDLLGLSHAFLARSRRLRMKRALMWRKVSLPCGSFCYSIRGVT